MGNGASCGENARDVGADEELNPMIMGDADKENNYRRPSVPHVQAVRVQCPRKPPRAFSAAAARHTKKSPPRLPPQERLKRKSALIRASMRQDDKKAMAQHVAVLRAGPKAGAEPPRAGTTKTSYHAPPTQEGWLAWATPNGSTRRYYRLVGSYLVRYADEEAARGAFTRRLDRWRLHGRERVYASRVDGVDADATPRRRRRDAAPPRRRLHESHSTNAQARRPSRPTPTARKP